MLHLFDKPVSGPTLNELLASWGGERPPTDPNDDREPESVWVLTTVWDKDDRMVEVFRTKAAALWSRWFEALEDAELADYWEGAELTPTQWLAETLSDLQRLRDDGVLGDYDIVTTLEEVKVQ
jgi:hypothetical protein